MNTINEILAQVPLAELQKIYKIHEGNHTSFCNNDNNDQAGLREFYERNKPPPISFPTEESLLTQLYIGQYYKPASYQETSHLSGAGSQHTKNSQNLNKKTAKVKKTHINQSADEFISINRFQALALSDNEGTDNEGDKCDEELSVIGVQPKIVASTSNASSKNRKKSDQKNKNNKKQTNIAEGTNRFAALAGSSDSEDEDEGRAQEMQEIANIVKKTKNISVSKRKKKRSKSGTSQGKETQTAITSKTKPQKRKNDTSGTREAVPLEMRETHDFRDEYNAVLQDLFNIDNFLSVNAGIIQNPPFIVRRRIKRIKHPEHRGMLPYVPEGFLLEEEVLMSHELRVVCEELMRMGIIPPNQSA